MNTMVTKTPKSVKPDAWIVTNNQNDKSKPSDKGRKSIKNGKVYLDDGQEFEIELYNPLKECVLCDIRLNGQSISKTGLVLKPGQRFYLDCFLDEKKKFIFNTYEVDNSMESIDAIENNGSLEVFFYKESVVNIKNWNTRFKEVIIERYYPTYYPAYCPYRCDWTYYPSIYYGTINSLGNVTTTTANFNSITSGSTYTTNGISGVNSNVGTTIGGGAGGIGSLTDYTTSYTSNNTIGNQTNCYYSSNISDSNETGRVEKGTKSDQKFTEIDMDFDSNYISSTIIQLLPTSRKPKEVKDLVDKKTGEICFKNHSRLNLKGDETIDLIKKLADLHSAGILTDDEFSSKKSELLSKI